MPPKKSKASTAVWPRTVLRATARKSIPIPPLSTKPAAAESSAETTTPPPASAAAAAPPVSTASVPSAAIESAPKPNARTASRSTAATVSGEGSAPVPAAAAALPKTKKCVAKAAGGVTEAAVIVTPEVSSGDGSSPAPATAALPKTKKCVARASGGLTKAAAIVTPEASSGESGPQTKSGIVLAGDPTEKVSPPPEAAEDLTARSEKVDGGGKVTAIEVAETTSKKAGGARTVVKRTVRVVKKIVKKKVPKKVLKGENDDGNPNCTVLGAVEVENSKSVESITPEAEDRNPVTLEADNPKDHVLMEVENCNANPCVSASMEIEKPCAYGNAANEIEIPGAPEVDEGENVDFAVSLNNVDEGGNTVSVTETQVENPNAGSIPEEDKENSVSVTETPLEDENTGSIREGEHDEQTVSAAETQLEGQNVGSIQEEDDNERAVSINESRSEDHNVGSIRKGTEECETENVCCGSGEDDEGDKVEMENCEMRVLKGGVGMGDGVLLSGVMEAMERRRRRRTEIFIGGLGKNVTEEDIRKVFDEVGEIVKISLVMSDKEGKTKGYAFLRFATADDAKKALAKHSKVEICGKQCGVSLVKGNDTIFLGNIDKKWNTEDVLKLLQGIGIEKIDTVTVMADPSNIECNRGFAFLELESSKDAQYAYKILQKKDVFGKNQKIKVAWAEPLNEPDEEEMLKVKAVYAEYIPSSWDEGKVRDFFQMFGEIESVALARNLPSSRRKDYAFVNYTTREAALACIDSFSRESFTDDDSKVNVKVSLAKPVPKLKQIKQTSNPTTKKSSQLKPKVVPSTLRPYEARNKGISSSSTYENIRVDTRSSTTAELVGLLREQASWRRPQMGSAAGLLREQASWRRPQMGSAAGSLDMDHPYPTPGTKRPFSTLRDDPLYSDPRQYPRARLESSFPVASPSGPSRQTGTASMPYYHRQPAGYAHGSLHSVEDPHNFQTRRAPDHGSTGLYRRY